MYNVLPIDEVFSTDHDIEGNILEANVDGLQSPHYTREQLVGKNYLDLCHLQDRELVRNHFVEAINQGTSDSKIYRFCIHENTYVFLQSYFKLKPKKSTGEIDYICSLHNIMRNHEGETNTFALSGSSTTDDVLKKEEKQRKQKTAPSQKKQSKSLESCSGSKKERKKCKSSSMADMPKKKTVKRHLIGPLGHEKKKKKSNPTIAKLETDNATAKTTAAPALKNGTTAATLEEEAADLTASCNLLLDSDMEQAMQDVMNVENTMGIASDAEMSASANEGDAGSVGYTKCPDGLQEPLKLNIMKIKEAAPKSEEGKCRVFTNEVNDLLLDIETQTRELPCGTRSSVFSHLSHHLPCCKTTLLKRAQKLWLGEQDRKLKALLQEAVGQAMPSQLERYQEECQTAAQARYDKMVDGKGKSEEEDDVGGGGGDKKKPRTKISAPRRKFTWTDHLRNLLCKVVMVKVRAYEMLKSRSQSAEDYIKSFLEAEIKGFWPQGWIHTRMLLKESRAVHQHLTSANAVKPKKPLPLPKKLQLLKKPSSPVPPETPTNAQHPAPSDSVGGESSYASSILKEMAKTKGTNNIQKDDPTLLDYANENNAAMKYSMIYSSTAKATGNTSAANPSLKTSGNVSKASHGKGTKSSDQHNVVKLQAGSNDVQKKVKKPRKRKSDPPQNVMSATTQSTDDVPKEAKKQRKQKSAPSQNVMSATTQSTDDVPKEAKKQRKQKSAPSQNVMSATTQSTDDVKEAKKQRKQKSAPSQNVMSATTQSTDDVKEAKKQRKQKSAPSQASTSVEGISDDDFKQLLADVSKWYDKRSGHISILKVLYRDHVTNTSELYKASKTNDLLELLYESGNLDPTNLTILYDTIKATQQLGLERIIKDRIPSCPNIKDIVISKFSPHRQKLINFGMTLTQDDVANIDQLYNVPVKGYADSWNLIMDLEKTRILCEKGMKTFVEKLRKNALPQSVLEVLARNRSKY